MLKKIIFVMGVVSFTALSGCATILNEPTKKVNLQTTNGEKAILSVDGVNVNAPGMVDLPRKKEGVMISSPDGKCVQTAVPSKVDTKFFINVLSGGAFGSTTDFASGEMWTYDDTLVVQCNK
jgi:uncharacterized protein YceK